MSSFADQQAAYRVECEAVAGIFRNPREIERLMHFMQPEGSTVSAFAKATRLTINAAYRKVQRYEQQGLVWQISHKNRAGRPMKVYACPFNSFFIPDRFVSLHEQVTEVFGPMQALMSRSLVEVASQGVNPVGGLLFKVTERGLWMLPAQPSGERWSPDPVGTPVTVHTSGPLLLNYEDARELARELHQLFDRYRLRRGGSMYLLHQILTPVPVPPQDFAFPHTGYTESV